MDENGRCEKRGARKEEWPNKAIATGLIAHNVEHPLLYYTWYAPAPSQSNRVTIRKGFTGEHFIKIQFQRVQIVATKTNPAPAQGN